MEPMEPSLPSNGVGGADLVTKWALQDGVEKIVEEKPNLKEDGGEEAVGVDRVLVIAKEEFVVRVNHVVEIESEEEEVLVLLR